jgi:SOS-response transcriptional repressor LexA
MTDLQSLPRSHGPGATRRTAPGTPLTPRQRAVFRWLVSRILEGRPPTSREMCAEFGWGSPQAAAGYLRAFAERGLIEPPDGGRPRLIGARLELVVEDTPAGDRLRGELGEGVAR